jgi:hypothetical protein
MKTHYEDLLEDITRLKDTKSFLYNQIDSLIGAQMLLENNQETQALAVLKNTITHFELLINHIHRQKGRE